jgi:uncharacterized NAD(P)/FAD-binding protein YdhS
MKKLTDYLIELNYKFGQLLDSLTEIMLRVKRFFYAMKDKNYFSQWLAKKDQEERDKTEQP